MKKYAFSLLVLCFVFASLTTMAQDSPWKPIARGQSNDGHWLVEQHRDTATLQRVFFYTKEQLLLYKEEVREIRININKDKSIKRLNNLLAKVAAEWKMNQMVAGHQLVRDHFN